MSAVSCRVLTKHAGSKGTDLILLDPHNGASSKLQKAYPSLGDIYLRGNRVATVSASPTKASEVVVLDLPADAAMASAKDWSSLRSSTSVEVGGYSTASHLTQCLMY